MQVTNEQLDKAAQAVWRVTADGLGLTWAWTDQAAVSRGFYRKLALAVLATLPDAQPDYCKKLEELAEWCESEARAYEKGSNGGDGFGFGYMNAMYAVAFRIRETLEANP